MNRRAYIAAGASVCLAGCLSSLPDDSSEEDGTGNGNETENGTADPTAETERPPADGTDRPDAAGTADDFEDLESWSVVGGRLAADRNRTLVGSQSARLEVPAGRRSAGLTKTFATPRDLTDVVPAVGVAADALVVPWLRLVDADGDSIAYRRGIAPDLGLLRHDFGVASIDSGFDASAVREVRLQVRAADGERLTVWFDDLHFTPRPETGKVLFQFDDGNVTDYTEALPILAEYGYPATTFVNTDTVGGGGRLTLDQLRELRDAGWHVGNHTADHASLPDRDAAGQEAAIRDGKRWLVDRGFETGAEYFAYPFGRYDATTIDLVDEHHSLGFGGGRPAHGYATAPGLLPRIGEPDADEARRAIELTAERRGITTFLYHRLEDESRETFETVVETVREYESRGDLEVILPRDLEERFLF